MKNYLRHKRFTKTQKRKAKVEHKKFKNRYPDAYLEGRRELLEAIVQSPVPNLNLKVTLDDRI